MARECHHMLKWKYDTLSRQTEKRLATKPLYGKGNYQKFAEIMTNID
jgi:hypothetical protein